MSLPVLPREIIHRPNNLSNVPPQARPILQGRGIILDSAIGIKKHSHQWFSKFQAFSQLPIYPIAGVGCRTAQANSQRAKFNLIRDFAAEML